MDPCMTSEPVLSGLSTNTFVSVSLLLSVALRYYCFDVCLTNRVHVLVAQLTPHSTTCDANQSPRTDVGRRAR